MTIRIAGVLAALTVAIALTAGSSGGASSCKNVIEGTSGPDTLIGTPAADRISGRGAGDRLAGEDGGDCIDGGPGSDRMTGGEGADKLDGGSGADTIAGEDGSDEVNGQAGNDRLSGGAGPDVLLGAAGNDHVDEVGDGYRAGETIDVGSNRIDTGPGRDVVDAANGKRDVISCGSSKDRVVADRQDKFSGCERRSFLISPFPQASPARGNRGRSFMVSFRSLATTDRKTEFFSIELNGPSGSCRQILTNSVGVVFHRGRVVRYRLRPFTGNGRPAKRWCRGLYRGQVNFVQIVKPGCKVKVDRAPADDCTDSARIGEFSFRVR